MNPGERSPTLNTGQGAPAVYQGVDASEDGTGRGTPLVIGDPRRHDERHRGWERPTSVHPTLGNTNPQTLTTHAIPRRLTPTECERLMGWPDGWTAWGIDDGGKRVEMADGPRYRMCGNGVGRPHSEWIGRRIAQDEGRPYDATEQGRLPGRAGGGRRMSSGE